MTPRERFKQLPFPVEQNHGRRPVLGRLVSLIGYMGTYLLVSAWILGAGVTMEVWGEFQGIALLLVTAPLIFFSFPHFINLVARGRRMRMPSALKILQEHPRPPVVLLRSFNDDDLIDPSFTATYKIVPGRYEQSLVDALSDLGPAITLGRPGEPEPQLGAARLYVKDADWQQAITYLMKHARLVVAIVGGSPGLWWEIELAIERTPIERLLFFFPFPASRKMRDSYWRTSFMQNPVWGRFVRRRVFPAMDAKRQARYDMFRNQINPKLPHPLPESLGKARFIYFSSDKRPQLINPAKPALLTQILTANFNPELDVPFNRELKAFVESMKNMN